MMVEPERNDAPRVLVVDDEPEILVALEDLFEEAFDVTATSSPAAALDMLAADPDFAVIVSDQRMPEMPGNVFLARARELSDAEAILLTGYADLSAIASAVNEGAISGYVHKPWEPEALLSMVQAAAERVRLRDALTFERSIYAALVEHSPDAVSVLDRAGRVLRTHRRDPATSDEVARADAEALARGGYSDDERRWTDARGDTRWTRTRRIAFGDDGSPDYLVRIESDETARRLTEQKLHQAEKLQALGTLAGGIAHDFNNLLAVVIGNLDLARRSLDDPDRLSRFLKHAADAANRGSAVSRRLLSFSRQRDLSVESFAPGETIEELRDLLVQAMAGRATVALDLAPDLWPVIADPGQFELALVNLCINARDAMADGGEVTIRATNADSGMLPPDLAPGDYVRIAVVDQGTGMKPEVQARVFEPFFTTKPHGVGTGLGLPIVRSMAQAAGGDVTIESAPGAGTTVSLWLPRAEAAAAAPAHPHQLPAKRRSLQVLLVEDDANLRATLDAQLRDLGHRVVAVGSGGAALDRLGADAEFDLLITDYAMPAMNGAQLIERTRDKAPDLPVLLITAYADFVTAPSAPVLTKPFTLEQLDEAMREAVA